MQFLNQVTYEKNALIDDMLDFTGLSMVDGEEDDEKDEEETETINKMGHEEASNQSKESSRLCPLPTPLLLWRLLQHI